jgi:hypothetical protein
MLAAQRDEVIQTLDLNRLNPAFDEGVGLSRLLPLICRMASECSW